ncbi:MAG: DUF948 domain-containing protein [Gemmatimonadales bacterium]
MLMFLQAVPASGWVGPTMAISLAIIALAFVVIAAATALTAKQATSEIQKLSSVLAGLRTDLSPALSAVALVSGEGHKLATLVGTEAEEIVLASRRFREGVNDRIARLDAVYEVLGEEVEETALELAVTLRRVRSGAGWFGMLRRLLGRGRSR